MGSLRDQLLKAKLITEKDARKAAQENRTRRKELGAEGVETEEARRAEEYHQSLQARADTDRERGTQDRASAAEKERIARLREVVTRNQIRPARSGSIRFYFVARDGKIPFLELSPQTIDDLEFGRAAVVETPGEARETFRVIPRDAALKLLQDGPEFIRVFNTRKQA